MNRKFTDNLADLLFPPRCILCDSILPFGERGICHTCQQALPWVEEPRCLKCGREIESEEAEYCLDCTKRPGRYIRGYPLFRYAGSVPDSLYRLKYGGRRENAAYFGGLMGRKFGAEFARIGIEALIPVPVHPARLKKRGYNQAELLARGLAKETGIPMIPDLLLRTGKTLPQKELTPEERKKNLRKAFSKNPAWTGQVPGIVLLTDDIYTTGATIEACTEILLESGVRAVYYTSVCVGAGA